jgi:hypothetical protein
MVSRSDSVVKVDSSTPSSNHAGAPCDLLCHVVELAACGKIAGSDFEWFQAPDMPFLQVPAFG